MKKNAGRLSGVQIEDEGLLLCFKGPDANQIWEALGCDVKDCSPTKPLRVTLKHAKTKGGEQTIDPVPWHPIRKFDLQTPPEMEIPEKWIRLSDWGRLLAISGIVGLFGWRILRNFLGQTENEFMNADLGMFSAYFVGIILISGLSLKLLCLLRIRAMTKNLDYISWETPRENTLKYVLLFVIAIFGLILLTI